METKVLYESDVVAMVREKIKEHGNTERAAVAMGCSAAYLYDFLRGGRGPGPKILKPLELEALTIYRKVDTAQTVG